MKKIIAALNLAEKATEDDAIVAIEQLKASLNEAKETNDLLKTSLNEAVEAQGNKEQSLEENLKEIATSLLGGDNPSDKKVYLTRDGAAFEQSNLSFCKEHAKRSASSIWLAETNKDGKVILTRV